MSEKFRQEAATNQAERRKHGRVNGPFDGWRISAMDTPIRLYDLSEGGCFVNSMHEQRVGVPITLAIDLPHEGRITVNAMTLYRREGGFAVAFVDMPSETAARLARALRQLRDEQ
jgi:hypothetical protein